MLIKPGLTWEQIAFVKTQEPPTTAKELKEALATIPDNAEIHLLLGDGHFKLLYGGPLDIICGTEDVIYLAGDLLRVTPGRIDYKAKE